MSKKLFKCPVCSETKFQDISFDKMECKKCGKQLSKSLVKTTVTLDDMSKEKFEEEYCTKCNFKSSCLSKRCYDEHYVNGTKIFTGIENLSEFKVKSKVLFNQEIRKNPGFLFLYLLAFLTKNAKKLNEGLRKPNDIKELIFAIVRDEADGNFDFVKKFFTQSWHLPGGSYLDYIIRTSSGEDEEDYSTTYKENKPYFFLFDSQEA